MAVAGRICVGKIEKSRDRFQTLGIPPPFILSTARRPVPCWRENVSRAVGSHEKESKKMQQMATGNPATRHGRARSLVGCPAEAMLQDSAARDSGAARHPALVPKCANPGLLQGQRAVRAAERPAPMLPGSCSINHNRQRQWARLGITSSTSSTSRLRRRQRPPPSIRLAGFHEGHVIDPSRAVQHGTALLVVQGDRYVPPCASICPLPPSSLSSPLFSALAPFPVPPQSPPSSG